MPAVSAREVTRLFDEAATLRVGHGLEAVVCAEFPVDVMEVVPERLGGDAQSARNGRGVAAVSEELENATLLLGKRFDRGVLGGGIGANLRNVLAHSTANRWAAVISGLGVTALVQSSTPPPP